jgi:hypothetical protein
MGTEIYNMIDWELYQKICTHQRKSIAMIKMVLGLTPTNSHLSKQNPQHTNKCPLFDGCAENIHHIMFCSANPEHLCMHSFKLTKKLKKYGDVQSLTTTLLKSLESLTSITDSQQLEDQQRIGWEHMIQGKIALSLQDYVTTSIKKIKTERKFLKDLCLVVMVYWKKLWLYRINKTTIAREISILQDKDRAMIEKLEEIYQYKLHLPLTSLVFTMLHSKKHSKSPTEKPVKKLTKITHFISKDPLKDTDNKSEGKDERTSNIHRPKRSTTPPEPSRSLLSLNEATIPRISSISSYFRNFKKLLISFKPSTARGTNL